MIFITSEMQRNPSIPNATRQEILLFVSCFLIMSILYATPSLINTSVTARYIKELLVDCLFMAIACLPVWWLHFRRLAHWSLKKRFFLHLFSAVLYYSIWMLLYQLYNPLDGKLPMTNQQILQNLGPNLLFYIQVFSILHMYHFFREREMQVRLEKELRELAYRGEINALKAQIQPHFLFNTLSSISASLPPEQEKTRVLIARLADTFRYALLSTKEAFVPLANELSFMENYLSLEKVRFGKRLQYRINIAPNVPQVQIPPMLLQPLVENAVKHGIEPALEGGEIEISCIVKSKKVWIKVNNTGNAYTGSLEQLFQCKGVGISNTAKRLERHYGEELAVSRNISQGLCFEFCIPIPTNQ